MSSPSSAPGPNDDSYELGDLELAPMPMRPVAKAPAPALDEELTTVVPDIRTLLPDNDMGLEFARGNQAHAPRETDTDDGFGDDPLAGPSLELDLPPDDPSLRRDSNSQPPQAPSSLRGSPPQGSLPRDSQSADRASAPRPSGGPRTSDPVDEERAARALAAFGEPEGPLGAARYLVQVGLRMIALLRERREVEQRASELAARYEQALRDLGRALLDDQAVRAHDGLRDRVLLVQTKQGELAKTEEATRAALAHEEQARNALAAKRAALEAELAPFVAAARQAEEAHQKIEAELKRKKAKLQRAEIELRALSGVSQPPPAERVQTIEAERARQQAELTTLAASHADSAAALGRAQRELALRRGGLDQLERDYAQQERNDQAQSRGHEEEVARAEHALSAALCGLAEAADAVGLAHAAAEQVSGLRACEAALDQVVDQLARYDRAMTVYDRDAALRGAAMWLGLLIVLVLLARFL